MEYFENLLSPTAMCFVAGAEVNEVVQKLLGGRASEGFCPDDLKSLDVVGLTSLTLSGDDQRVVRRFVAGIRISTSQSQATVLDRKTVA